MSVTYTIDGGSRTVFITARDSMNRSMLEDAFARAVRDPAFDPAFDTLADFTDVVHLDLSLDDIRALVEKVFKRIPAKGRFAIITGHDQGRYSLGMYFNALAEGVSFTRQRVFRTPLEAQSWLNRP